MRLDLIADDADRKNTCRIEHKGRAYTVQVVLYVKSILRIKFDIYEEINAFLAILPLEQQDRLFEQYWNVFQAMEDITVQRDSVQLVDRIATEVARLFDIVPEHLFNAWITDPRSGILLPPRVEFEKESMYEDMTYSLEDHIKLAGYALALRLMMPIWGMYNRSANEEKETAFKEMNSVKLIAYSWLSTCAAKERLKTFTARVLQPAANKANITAAFAGIGRDETVDYQLSKVIVRRLPIAPINNDPDYDKSTLVSNVYNFIKPTPMTSLDRNFDATVADKHSILNSGDGEERTSFSENYKIRERLSAGDAEIISYSIADTDLLVKEIDPTLPKHILQECSQALGNHDVTRLLPHQIALLKFVIGIAHSPDSIDCGVNAKAILSAICVTQAMLWHWGFHHLAAMLTVVVPENNIVRERGQTNRLTKEETLRMKDLYPYNIPVGKNFKGDEYLKAERDNTTSFIAIREFADWTESRTWITTCPELLLEHCIGHTAQRYIITPENIKSMLSKLIVKINDVMDSNYKRKKLGE